MDKIPKEELIADLHRLQEELGRTPNSTDVETKGNYARSTYKDRFGTWKETLEAAGIEHDSNDYVRGDGIITDEQLIEGLRNFADELGRIPGSEEMNEDGPYSYLTYRKRFGGWQEAKEAAGLE